MPESAGLRRWFEAAWYAPQPRVWLLPFAWLFGLVVALRRAAHARGILRSAHPGAPVIVVGNLVAGGSGKTPLVLWLATQLRDRGLRPGIVLRGYGGRQRAPRLVQPGDAADLVGDEALLLAGRAICPVAVGARRAAAATLLVDAGCNVVIADDGLQHLALRRDLAIVVVDAARGFGNGALLPAGPLREPVSRLPAADCVVLNGSGSPPLPQGLAPVVRMSLQLASLRALRGAGIAPPESLRGESVHAVAGIGHPARFFSLLRGLGARPVEHAFADHHAFTAQDLQFGDDRRIVMTEKDAVKCRSFATQRMWWLPVDATLSGADAAQLLQKVMAVISTRGGARA